MRLLREALILLPWVALGFIYLALSCIISLYLWCLYDFAWWYLFYFIFVMCISSYFCSSSMLDLLKWCSGYQIVLLCNLFWLVKPHRFDLKFLYDRANILNKIFRIFHDDLLFLIIVDRICPVWNLWFVHLANKFLYFSHPITSVNFDFIFMMLVTPQNITA